MEGRGLDGRAFRNRLKSIWGNAMPTTDASEGQIEIVRDRLLQIESCRCPSSSPGRSEIELPLAIA